MIDFDDLIKKDSKRVIIIVILSFFFLFYIYVLMFGERSYIRLLDLNGEYEKLKHHVNKLKKENEKLQKEYFELKQLQGGE